MLSIGCIVNTLNTTKIHQYLISLAGKYSLSVATMSLSEEWKAYQ